jgi:hypothetical protein
MAEMKTSRLPEATPRRLSGSSTRKNALSGGAPSEAAAGIRFFGMVISTE